MNVTRKMRSRDLIRICLRRPPSGTAPQAPPEPRAPRRPANWPVTRTTDVDTTSCPVPPSAEAADTSAPVEGDADSDPPSPPRLAHYASLAGAIILGGALLLGFSATPANAQDSGGGDGGSSSSSTSSSGDGGGGMSSSSMSSSSDGGGMSSSSDGGGMSSSSDGGGMSSSSSDGGGMSSTSSDGGMSSSDSSSMSSTFSSSSYGSSDSGYGGSTASTDSGTSSTSSDSGATSSFSSSSYGSSDSSYGGSTVSTDSGTPSTSSDSATTSSFSSSSYGASDSGYGGSTASTDSGTSSTSSDSSTTSSFSSSSYGASDSSYGSSYSATDSSGLGSETSTSSASTESGYGVSTPTAATDTSTYSGSTDTSAASGFSDTDSFSSTPGYALSDTPGISVTDTTAAGTDVSTEATTADAVTFAEAAAPTDAVTTADVVAAMDTAPTADAVTTADVVAAMDADAPAWTGELPGPTVPIESLGLPYRTGMEDSPELSGLAWDMQTQEALGRLNADQTRQVLSAIGINPDGFHPSQLQGMDPSDPQYQQLYSTIRTMADPMANPLRGDDRLAKPYSARAYETLDDEGTLATMGAINRYALDSVRGIPLGDVRAHALDPMAKGLGLATLSNIAPTDVFDGLRNIESGWQQHLVSQLISGDYTYDAQAGRPVPVDAIGAVYDQSQLARFADAVIDYSQRHPNGVLNRDDQSPTQAVTLNMLNPTLDPTTMMYAGPDAWDGDLAMNVPEALAWRALAANPLAAYRFTGMERDNITATMRVLNNFDGQLGYTAEENQRLAGLINDYTTETIRNSFIDAVRADPSLLPGAVDRFADMTDEMAQRNVLAAYQQAYLDALATVLVSPEGRVTMPYFDDIGREAVRQRATPFASDAEREAQNFNRVDLTSAFAELGLRLDTAATLARTYGIWGNMQLARLVDDGLIHAPQKERDAAVQSLARPVALVGDVIRQGFENNALPTDDAQGRADTVALVGQLTGAIAGPVANYLAGQSRGLATLAGIIGSSAWGGSTAHTAYQTSLPTPAISGSEFGAMVTAAMRQNMANAVAAYQGTPPPVGGQVFGTLDDAFGGDPFTTLDTMMNTEQLRNTEARQRTQGLQHWSR